jgi:predicted secreted protein
MKWFFNVALYVIVWWLTLFAVLPWGVKPTTEAEPGHDRGAPVLPNLWKKALATTAIATVLWFVLRWAFLWELARIRTQPYG